MHLCKLRNSKITLKLLEGQALHELLIKSCKILSSTLGEVLEVHLCIREKGFWWQIYGSTSFEDDVHVFTIKPWNLPCASGGLYRGDVLKA